MPFHLLTVYGSFHVAGAKLSSYNKDHMVVRPHTLFIRFPDRRDNPKPNISEHSEKSKLPDLLMHQGLPDTAEIIKTLPQKYRRKLVSQEEIELIQLRASALGCFSLGGPAPFAGLPSPRVQSKD
ncbi:unnamed protein product [Nyctereutes procyonoides]|uniref:(raccoon dog) hypothetical protein n=1 Tax=Nyctereutes procyonoides TaxID=34880 RepID=A0A811ZJH5_NYCPR|nr:unnamed protein product [Nyctereutes procyonoides]